MSLRSSSYQVTLKKPSLNTEKQQAIINNVLQEKHHSGVLLEPKTAGLPASTTCGPPERKTGLSKVLQGVATSSISGKSL